LRSNQFYAPGSIFRASVDTKSPIGFGMPSEADLYFVSGARRASERGPGGPGPSSQTPVVAPLLAELLPPAWPGLGLQPGLETGAAGFGGNAVTLNPTIGFGMTDIDSAGNPAQTAPARGASGQNGQASTEERSSPVSAFAFDITDAQRARSVARYVDGNPLRSGWLLGPNYIAGHSALVDVSLGKGHVVLFGFRTQHRAQTWGTFRFLFNAIYLGA
jgi:hypothetical protein